MDIIGPSQLSINAVRGSGGVGFFIKDSVYSSFDVYELDKSCEGIFWIKLVSKQDESFHIYVCACYLTPESSCRGNVAQEFFDNLPKYTCIRMGAPLLLQATLMREWEPATIIMKY